MKNLSHFYEKSQSFCPSQVGRYALRLLRFHQKIATSTRFVQPENLPLTPSVAKYHSVPSGANMEGGIKAWSTSASTKS